jgi:hypothetical protein
MIRELIIIFPFNSATFLLFSLELVRLILDNYSAFEYFTIFPKNFLEGTQKKTMKIIPVSRKLN